MSRNYLTLREIQLAELEVLKAFDVFCRTHGLDYTVFGGTMLGAVRHGGFIPWDDDVDLAMAREDYDRFLELVYDEHETLGEHIQVLSGDRDESFALPFIKIMRDDILLDESEKDYRHDGDSIWLDVFPLDELPADTEDIHSVWAEGFRLQKSLTRAVSVLFRKREGESILKCAGRSVLTLLMGIKGYRYYKNTLIRLAKTHYPGSRMIGNIVFGVEQPELEMLSKEEYAEKKDILFEGYQLMTFASCEDFLARRYGDWRRIPPESERGAHDMKAYRKEERSGAEED